MGKWFPRFYDTAMKPFEKTKFKRIRTALLNKATGSVLEIGSGSGINFPLYKLAAQVDAIEPNLIMAKRSLQQIEKSRVPIQLHANNAESLPFDDDIFDSVVATLVFCTIPDPMQTLQEIKRVCKPGANILLFEHVRLNQAALAKTQDLLTPVWKKVCDGCHLNRDIIEMLTQSGLSIEHIDSYFKGLFLSIECVYDH